MCTMRECTNSFAALCSMAYTTAIWKNVGIRELCNSIIELLNSIRELSNLTVLVPKGA